MQMAVRRGFVFERFLHQYVPVEGCQRCSTNIGQVNLSTFTRNVNDFNLNFCSVYCRCQPQVKVAFMKTHKCASSTIENILFRLLIIKITWLHSAYHALDYRHAYHNKLNIVMPSDGNYLSRTDLFDKKVVDETPWSKLDFQVFTLHNRWNYEQVDLLMGPDTKYFTILRDPVDLFESLFAYSQLNRFYRMNLTQLIEAIDRDSFNSTKRLSGYIGRNQLSWDLGIQPEDFDNETAVLAKVAQLEKQFHLVLITEMMDESLILLQDLLCWPVQSITHLSLNQRKQDDTVHLTQHQRDILKNWLKADYIIYDHFRRRLDAQLNQSDITFTDKLLRLKDANEQLAQRCVEKRVANDQLGQPFRGFSRKQMGYTVK